ncbi:MAG: nucleotide exchange factor GrpE [Chloroflexia bacterium]|nr:nucleotide exchange factor GrpE [Chloroflexia bacterium]
MTEKRETNPRPMNGEPSAAANDAATAEHEAIDLKAVLAERDSYLDQLQRSRADLANFRRRTEQERAQIREIANQALLSQLLPVLDDFQRALAAVPEAERATPLVEGLTLIERKFWSVLERAGVRPLEVEGQAFDPSLHEAVESVPGSAANTVVDVYQPGYRIGQTLLRPAIVKLGDAPATAASASDR